MSLITKCPACTTMFKVVPDQLRISDGWVRCGQCNEVFDANAHLEPQSPAMLASVTQPSTYPRQTMPSAVAQVGHSDGPTPSTATATETETETDRAFDATSDPSAPFLEVNPRALHIDHEAIPLPAKEPPAHWGTTDHRAAKTDDPVAEEEVVPTSSAQHSFMQNKSGQPSVWTSRSTRVGLSLLSFVLGVALVLQAIVFERDRIAATWPQSVYALHTLCAPLACIVSPLRQIESVVIDSSAFTKIRGEVYRLSFTLKNTAPTRLATPSMELTLTDTQDQPVARRVFDTHDFAGASTVVEAGAELQASVPISVKLAGNHEKISGYRLLSFYP